VFFVNILETIKLRTIYSGYVESMGDVMNTEIVLDVKREGNGPLGGGGDVLDGRVLVRFKGYKF
jgi:hypothetical protein